MARAEELHIVVFTDTFYETNGVGTFYRTLLGWARENGGAQVTVICPSVDSENPDDAPYDVIPVRGSLQFANPFYKDLPLGYFSVPRLCREVERLPGNKVVHVATCGAMGVAGAKVARQLGLPLVGWYNTDLQHYGRLYGHSLLGRAGAWVGESIALACERLAYGKCAAISVPSATAEQTVRNFYRGPVRVIPYPLDLERFRPAETRLGEFRERYNTRGGVLVAAVGRVAKEKNLDLLCELLVSDPRIDLVLVGGGPYAEELRRRWGVRITGFLHGDELVQAYQQSDVMVQLSVSETFGLALVEALACGLPAIALRSPGFVDTILPGQGVEVLDSAELPMLAERCVRLVGNPRRHREQSRLARQLVGRLAADAVLPQFVAFHRAFAPVAPPLAEPLAAGGALSAV
ncbi:MAG: glycosyltransferase [Planctomycetes bacterium]|nr:glycosyltransferase [Planctomycetota bacterium]